MSARLLFTLSLSFFAIGCSPTGFSTVNLAGLVPSGSGSESGTPTTASGSEPSGGQPGSVILTGAFVKKDQATLILSKAILVSQVAGKGLSGNSATSLQPENQVQLEGPAPAGHLDQIQERSDFVQIGCNPASGDIANLLRGLKPAKTNYELKDSLSLKAKLVVLCGKAVLSQPFVSIVADQLVLKDFNFEIRNPNGVGALSVMARKVTLLGSNSVLSKGQDSAGAIIDGPSIFMFAQNEVSGEGTLEIKTLGGNRSASGK